MLKGKRVLIGISGGIAAYKIPDLIRLFIKEGAEVRVVTTKNALNFVTPLTLESVSGNKVYSNVFGRVNDYSTEHISMATWGDILVVAPCTANIIAKFANGICDDALSTTFLAFDKPVFVALAMNVMMYNNPAFQHNLDILSVRGVNIIDAKVGDLACGVTGKGRMAQPQEILDDVKKSICFDYKLKHKKIMITAGPTYEQIDPVRFIGNNSSGKMGYELAKTCAERGAEVLLISGPVALSVNNPNIKRIDVRSAQEMYSCCVNNFKDYDAAILCAAVADFTPERVYDSKQKRGKDDFVLKLKPTKDIAASLGEIKSENQVLVGFALETDNEEDNAKKKLKKKNFNFIVLNSLNDSGAGFQCDTNKITIIDDKGKEEKYSLKSKKKVSIDILDKLENYI